MQNCVKFERNWNQQSPGRVLRAEVKYAEASDAYWIVLTGDSALKRPRPQHRTHYDLSVNASCSVHQEYIPQRILSRKARAILHCKGFCVWDGILTRRNGSARCLLQQLALTVHLCQQLGQNALKKKK